MNAEKVSMGKDILKASFVKERKITELQIVDARSVEEVVFPGKDGKKDSKKIDCLVSYKGQEDNDPKWWRINSPSRNSLIDAWGSNTDDWVMKPIPITLNGSGEMEHILVDSMRIE